MDKNAQDVKDSIEARYKAWQKILDEKDGRINSLIEENQILKNELSRKMIMRPAVKDRIMGEVGRVIAQLRSDIRKSQISEKDKTVKLEEISAKYKDSLENDAAQKKIIDDRDAQIKRLREEVEKKLSEQQKKLNDEFENKLKRQMIEAAAQIDTLMKEIASLEKSEE